MVNDSAVFLDVQPGPASTVTDSGSPDASTFADAVNGFVPASSAAVEGHTLVPPGGWVVAEDLLHAVRTYAHVLR